ncbi:SMC-Scp complex subunit ScpB [Faucicola boevrei]|uniref:SMC-Scp complex subunit ScpB n=1 Tax=Faucicola boevrei TaxID=346665 RepID=UPI00035E6F00|nr:SMC-Scp complex subunit ScpB [Moraxella boevrei]
MSDFQQKHQTAFSHSRAIEAVLHASESPVADKQLRQYLHISQDELDTALIVLQQRLSTGALTLAKTANGYRLQIADEFSPLIQQIFPQRQETLSQALLETLSIIAYKQPVTRADIEQVRGVTVSSHILRQLFDKGWIEERGYKDTLGRPALLHTTSVFLEVFGLASIDDLPKMPELGKTDE